MPKFRKLMNRKVLFIISLALIPVLLCVIFLSDRRVAKPVDASDGVRAPRYGVQDPRAWGQGAVRLVDEPLDMGDYQLYVYQLDHSLLQEYLAMLEENGFQLVDEHHQSSFLGAYESYGLICAKADHVSTRDMMYTDTPCHINIWRDGTKWRIEVPEGMQMWDLGLRRDGRSVSVRPRGESLEAGLRRSVSGKYKTTDGRLKTKVDFAAVICDDEEISCPVTWEKSGSRRVITVEISDELTAQIIYLPDELKQGDVLLLDQPDHNHASFKLTADGDTIVAQQQGVAQFRNVTLRVMYVGEDGDVVLYLYAQPMDQKKYPDSIEILCAIDTKPKASFSSGGGGGVQWGDGNGSFQPNHSKLDCLTCRGSGDCTTCGGDGYTDVGGAKGGCRSCHGNGDCTACGGSGKR